MSRRLLAAAFGFSLFAASQEARAFCLTHGCNDSKMSCNVDTKGCLTDGPQLHWASGCVSFDVQRDGSALRGISYDAAHSAIVAGFSQWLNADCGDGQKPGISISDYGPVSCGEPEYNQDAPNANVFMFRDDDWPYANAIDTLALTTLIYDADTGEIYDADVEVNTHESAMATDNVGPSDIDFNSVITHEIGHFLGLSHSNTPGSTMRPSYAPGRTDMASIELDDEQGICAALPPSRATDTESCDPRHGFSSECALEDSNCSVATPRPGRFWPGLAALALCLSSLGLRRRLRPSSPRP
jgi:hypothetical protein